MNAIDLVIDGKPRAIDTLTVTRILPERHRRNVGPFVFLDHMGPAAMEPGQGMDVRPHPHIGLATVTYLYDGSIVHRDSLGIVQTIEPGAINLMSAGRGIVHSERSDAESRAAGVKLHGIQIWLALPREHENDEPTFAHHPAPSLPAWDEAGTAYRLLLGEAYGRRSPVESPARPVLVALELAAGARVTIPALPEAAVYVVDGELALGNQHFAMHQLAVIAAGETPELVATRATRALILGGPPLDAPRFMEWNFVGSSRALIDQAKAAWQAREFPAIPGDDVEFIPLPTL